MKTRRSWRNQERAFRDQFGPRPKPLKQVGKLLPRPVVRAMILGKVCTMTEAFLREIATRYGLEVLKRVTTGTEKAGFATFELSGHPERVRDAYPEVKAAGHRFTKLTKPTNPDHEGGQYIEVDSVYVDAGK